MPQTQEVAELQEAGQLAKRLLLEDARAMYGVVMGTDGETFGDRPMIRGDRLLRIVMAANDRSLDVLRDQSPRIYQREMRDFQHDLTAEMEAGAKVPSPVTQQAFAVAAQQQPFIDEMEGMA
jgi:hypothetical protein